MTETTSESAVRRAVTESVDEFAERARAWLATTMPRVDPRDPPDADRGQEGPWLRAKELQKMLHGGGFAGICFPREYGGLGLPYEYQKAFDAVSVATSFRSSSTHRPSPSVRQRFWTPAAKSRSGPASPPCCAARRSWCSC